MSKVNTETVKNHVSAQNSLGASSVVLVCEHASYHIPDAYNGLGLTAGDRQSHAAWDPGALGVATYLAECLDAGLISSGVSRLVYDCNRPPDAADAMPARSEIIDVPGNRDLDQSERDARTESIYKPFHAALEQMIKRVSAPILVTIHSFTPIYHGKLRSVEIGILHDSDSRLADAMLETAGLHLQAEVRRNEPYGPEHGVTHTLKEHAIKEGHLNVMIEVRNDLIATTTQQAAMAATLAKWIVAACSLLGVKEDVQCRV